MAFLGAVIQAFVRSVLDARRNLAFGRAVGSELIGDEALRCSPLLLHQSVQQAFHGFLIAPTLENLIQNNAVRINCAPQPELPPLDLHDNVVQMPDIAGLRLPTAQTASDGWTKLHNPSSDGVVRDIDPSHQKHLFDLTKTEVETTIQPDCMSDDCWRKTVALVTD